MGALRRDDKRLVALAWQHQADVYSAARGALKLLQHLVVRREVGVGNIDVGFGIRDGGNDGYVNEAESLGHAGYYPHYIIAVFCQFRKIFPGTEQWAFLIVPLADESLLKLRNRGPLYLDVGVTPELQGCSVLAGRQSTRIVLGDINATGESDPAVHEHHLAMISMGKRPGQPGGKRIERTVLHYCYSIMPHPIEESGRRAVRAKAVVHQVDLHAVALPIDQRFGKGPTHLPVRKYKHLNVDTAVSGANRRQHGVVSLRAVLQQDQLVAERERHIAQYLFEDNLPLENIARDFLMLLEARDNLLALARRDRAMRSDEVRS